MRVVVRGLLAPRRHPDRTEAVAYGLFAAGCSLWAAHLFFAALRFQLFLSENHNGFISATQPWSAPLDDVFIHFDFARSAARGFPFEWSEGNGYSSGGTSLLYPFVLAIGYRLGYLGTDLMLWAGMVAVACIFLTLLMARSLAFRLPRWCSWLLPPMFLSTGVLNWTLWSGMEVAFFFFVWAVCAKAFVNLVRLGPALPVIGPALWLGLGGAVLVSTRPESAVIVACFSLFAVATRLRKASPLALLSILLAASLPGVLVLVGQAVANRLLTGDFSAAGAQVKLELNDPYLSPKHVFDAWKFHFEYQLLRITQYHFSSVLIPIPGLGVFTTLLTEKWPELPIRPISSIGSGWVVWVLALLGSFDPRTRTASLLLWASTLTFMAVVALNGQVRWQNERYAMPAVGWLLLNAGLGLGVALCRVQDEIARLRVRFRMRSALRAAAGTLAGGLAVLFWIGQTGAHAEQRWFFGRAARNIFDQHMSVGMRLRQQSPAPKRVLVGDAGAIPYVADLPALDLIGLGGYRDLPFARATRFGVAAALELVERMPPVERPDLLALYPGWWGDLPIWFGREEWAAGVRGNVICGGAEKVLYRPDWLSFTGSQRPSRAGESDVVALELDFADVVSEASLDAEYVGAPGYVAMKMLPHPSDETRDLWDAGRILPAGSAVRFSLRDIPSRALTFVLRVAPVQPAKAALWLDGEQVVNIELSPSDAWQEPSYQVPKELLRPSMQGRLEVLQGDVVLYHLWGVGRP